MKKILKIITFIFLVLILFRGSIYRATIKYNETGTRKEFKITNQKILNTIQTHAKNKTLDQEDIISIASSITIESLSFSTKQTSINPNELFNSKKANCTGYAALFNSIANHLIIQNELTSLLKAKHQVGQLELLGLDLHQFFKSPFFKNHDYNQINNLVTGEVVLVDASLNDYLGIERVSLKN